MLIKRGGLVLLTIFAASFVSFRVKADTSSSTFSIDVSEAVIQLEVPASANIMLAPTSSAAVFGSTTITASVATNNVLGYTLTMTPTNSASSTDLISSEISSVIPTLATLDGGYTENSFTTNRWGYRLASNENFFGMPAKLAPDAWDANGPTNGTDYNLTLAAKVDGAFPASDYSTTLNFEVVAKRGPLDWDDIIPETTPLDPQTNLPVIQAITGDICRAVETYDTQFQVTDLRDHKNYWISKLQDGHCWMTQNLDLDLVTVAANEDAIYTHANTDLGYGSDRDTTEWRPNSATITTSGISAEDTISGWSNQNYTPVSVDPGDWYWTDTWYPFEEDVTDKFATTPYPGNGTHGHIGNFYNWTAAIASNDIFGKYTQGTYSDVAKNPQNSICPAHWRLPTVSDAGYGEDTTSEFFRLTYLYANNTSQTSSGDDKQLVAAPLYFVRGGWISGGTLTAGRNGEYWSSTVATQGSAYWFHFAHNYIGPSSSSDNYNGMSVRCVARDPEVTIARAFELAYTSNHKGIYIKNQDGSYHEMQPGEVVPGGTDTRFAMQDIDLTHNDTKVCDLVNVINDQYQALDTRDWKLYYISKLADGNCWMTQNLDTDLSTNKTFTTADTDIPTDWTPSVSTGERSMECSTNSQCSDEHNNDYAPASVDPGDLYWNGTTASSSEGFSPTLKPAYFESTGNTHYHIGNYYNFSAAVAMNGTSSYGERQKIDQSICPNGWRLPDTTAAKGSYIYLAQNFQNPLMQTSPVYLVPGGYYQQSYVNESGDDDGEIVYKGEEVNYDGYSAYLMLNTTATNGTSSTGSTQQRSFHPAGYGNPSADVYSYPSLPRFLMLPIRCLAR